jgi:hypothetical protein
VRAGKPGHGRRRRRHDDDDDGLPRTGGRVAGGG